MMGNWLRGYIYISQMKSDQMYKLYFLPIQDKRLDSNKNKRFKEKKIGKNYGASSFYFVILYKIMFDALKKSLFLPNPVAILKKHKVNKSSDLITEKDFTEIMKVFVDIKRRK